MDGGNGGNHNPEVKFTFGKVAVPIAGVVVLTVEATDPDDDPVTVNWEATGGTLRESDQGSPSMQWSAPLSVGKDTITVTASDGKGGQATAATILEVATPKNANIGTPVTWRKDQSPYLITNEQFAIVGAVGRLVLEPGVLVYIDNLGGKIIVEGTLDSNGAHIKPNTPDPTPGWWVGIEVRPNSTLPVVNLGSTEISYAQNAVDAAGPSKVKINGGKITFCSEEAVLFEAWDSLSVRDCVITNNQSSGIRVHRFAGSLPLAVIIEGDSIAVNGKLGEDVQYTHQAGISIDIPDTGGSVPIVISGCNISRNDFPGIRLLTGCEPRIIGNYIAGNEFLKDNKFNVRLESGFSVSNPTTSINATQNYWGFEYPNAADSLLIHNGIHDRRDSGSVGAWIYVTPWLNNEP